MISGPFIIIGLLVGTFRPAPPTTAPDIPWPEGKAFAFTIFDDPDGQTTAMGREVYAFLRDLGFRTTKGVWPLRGEGERSCNGGCCEDEDYLEWCRSLQQEGFEIGYHNASQNTAHRALTIEAFDRYAQLFGGDPVTMSNHYNNAEGIYWGDLRLSGMPRLIYNVVTGGRNRGRFFGHLPGHPLYWGDLCRARVQYVRNFIYRDINTLRACPIMPYHDPLRPLVQSWYASSEGADHDRFVETISEANQDRLVAERGACIMYAHFGHRFVTNGRIEPRFRDLMTRLSRMNGWFVPVGTLLDHLRSIRGVHRLTDSERRAMEWRWLAAKVRHGTS
jgi:hypothetical protein